MTQVFVICRNRWRRGPPLHYSCVSVFIRIAYRNCLGDILTPESPDVPLRGEWTRARYSCMTIRSPSPLQGHTRMRLGRKHKAAPIEQPRLASPGFDPLAQLRTTWATAPPAGSDKYWRMLKDLPIVKDWRVLSDAVFLLLSFGLGLFWLLTIVVLGAVGAGLAIVGIGIPILAALFALVIWGAQLERHRLRVFLDATIPSPYRDFEPATSPWRRAWRVLRNPQLWRDMCYLLLLMPLGILGLVVVWIPIPFLVAPLIFILGGDASLYFWDISHFFEAIVAMLVGLILVLPFSVLINLAALLHVEVAKRFLAPPTA